MHSKCTAPSVTFLTVAYRLRSAFVCQRLQGNCAAWKVDILRIAAAPAGTRAACRQNWTLVGMQKHAGDWVAFPQARVQ